MSFKLAVETFSGRLTDSDRTLVSIILSDPSQVVFYSAHELANQAGVHASTTNNEYVLCARKNISRIIYIGLGDGLFDGLDSSDFRMH